jgi:hypothetical protein
LKNVKNFTSESSTLETGGSKCTDLTLIGVGKVSGAGFRKQQFQNGAMISLHHFYVFFTH